MPRRRTQLLRNRNEVMQGPAPACEKALRSFSMQDIAFYEDGYFGSALIPALSKRFGVPEERIIESYGAEDFLRMVFDRLRSSTDCVLTHEYCYGFYKSYLSFKGISLHTFAMNAQKNTFSFDCDGCIAACRRHRPKVVIITSPNNPTGNVLRARDCARILKVLPRDALFIVDQAYWGFDPSYEEHAFLRLIDRHPNLVLLRSFSKYYALAGLRIGFALCGADVSHLLSYQRPYLGMCRLLEDIAVAALQSRSHYRTQSARIISQRQKMIDVIGSFRHMSAFASSANFFMLRVHPSVVSVLNACLKKIPVLTMKHSQGDLWRITVGLPAVNASLLAALREADRTAVI